MTGPAAALPEAGVGALLRAYRERAGLSQEALAARAGLAPAAVSALERGVRRRPYPHTVAALARALRLSAAERATFTATARAPAAAPPRSAPRSATAPARPAPSNLPAPPTPLIGREQETAALADLLGHDGERLVTLTGVGGAGKTRLALEVAHGLVGSRAGARSAEADGGDAPDPGLGPRSGAGATEGVFPDGVWLVELAPLADPALVPQAVAAALGVREAPGVTLIDSLTAALRTQALLLVLDNCEHLLDASAALAERLLAACPGVRILATSREPLQIPGERQHPVPPLAVPEPGTAAGVDDLAGYPAVRLFVARAQAVAPGFALTPENAGAITQVCTRLAGIPLALELAAARAGVLSVAQIAARLDDALRLLTGGSRAGPTRQQTLRGALDWSHDLLAAPERAAFRRLAVFAGGFDLEAAEAVCGEDDGTGMPGAPVPGEGEPPLFVLRPPDVLDALTNLVHRSLVVAESDGGPAGGEPRYRLLEPVRQYAAERLAEAGEAAPVRSRHAAWAAGLAEQAGPGLFTRDQLRWLARLDAEHDNLRAALAWCIERQPEVAVRVAGRLWPYWRMRERFTEGRRTLIATLAMVPGGTADWARATLGAGILSRDHCDVPAARAYLEASLEASRILGETSLVAWALRDLGQLHVQCGEFGPAERVLSEGLAIARIAGDQRGAAASLMILAQAAVKGGELDRARTLNEESLAAARQAGDRWLITASLLQAGSAAVDRGDLQAAAPVLEEGLAVARELGLHNRVGRFQWQLGRVALARGDLQEAVPLLEALRDTASERDAPRALADALVDLARVSRARDEWGEASAMLREALRLRQTADDRLGMVECLEGLAAAGAGAGADPALVARLLGAAAAGREALGAPPPPLLRADLTATEHAARTALGPAAAGAARAAGAALSLEQAAAEVLREPAAWIPPVAARPEPAGPRPMPSRAGAPGSLTPREREVAALLAAGCHTDRQLAERLTITPGTAGVHVQRILDKLGLHSRWEVADWARGDDPQAASSDAGEARPAAQRV